VDDVFLGLHFYFPGIGAFWCHLPAKTPAQQMERCAVLDWHLDIGRSHTPRQIMLNGKFAVTGWHNKLPFIKAD